MTTVSHDPGSSPESEGIPDIADDAFPERALVDDPELPSLPGDQPVAVDRTGTTVQEQIDGESLDERLAEEEPELVEDPLRPRYVDEPLDADGDPSLDAPAGSVARPDELPAEEAALHVDDGP